MDDVKGRTVMGIHLGMNHSRVGVWRRGAAEIAINSGGKKMTPSYVAFTGEERLVGDAAFSQVSLNPTNTIFEVEHLMGRKFHDQTVQRKMRSWPFKVVPGSDDRPLIAVQYKGEDKLFSAEEISSMILRQMREIAETCLGQTIRNAVITCPAYFSDAQRRATRDAGVIAELNVLRIINEPTAAAIAYGLDNSLQGSDKRKNVLIFDLGAGTLDVSLLTINNGNIEVRATTRDTHLGGEDFNNSMVDHFVKEFKTKNYVDISNNPKSMRRLRLACEKAKRDLSTSHNTTFEIGALYEGIDFETNITRDKFEDLNEELFSKCLEPLERCLWDAKMSKSDVDEVVLVGGSTRIPKVQELLEDFFIGKKLNHSMNPDLDVTLGATINAAMLVGEMPALVLMDVTPLSLGIELESGIMSVVIPRDTPYPVERETYIAVPKEETSIVYDIYEGERTMARENNLLGSFKLSGITPFPAFAPLIRVTFRIDGDGILIVSATDMENENSAEVTVTNEKGRLSQEEIDRMIEDGRRYRQEDEEIRKKVIAMMDVTPLSLGIELKSGVMSVVIPRNTPYPIKRETYLSIPKEETTAVYYVYEGERIIARENNLLGSLKLSGIISGAPVFLPQIKVTFQIDADGRLNVSALDIKSGTSAEFTISIKKGRLSREEIDRMIEDGRRYKQEDERKKKTIAKNELEKYVSSVKSTLRDRFVASAITTDQKDMFESTVRMAQEWLNDQSLETEASEYDIKRIELENIFTHFEANIKSQSNWIKSSAEGIM